MLPPPSPLSEDDRRRLLSLARCAITEALCRERSPEVAPASGLLVQPSGAFVTLRRSGRLCGCIGHVEPSAPLAETITRCAVAAALEDQRFRPLRADELADLEIEISVLSPLVPIRPEQIEMGSHGLLVLQGTRRGLLLPQVAAGRGWTRDRFLEETCAKAGLERDSWKAPATQLMAFTAQVFSESELRAAHPAPAG